MENVECVELYFTGKFSDDATLAFWIPEGIILSSRIDDLTLAHELGHALGLMDCFYTRKGRTLDCADLYVTRSTFVEGASNDEEVQGENAPNPVTLDWWHESWRGFYTMEDRVRTVIDGLLMHGMPEDGKFDIPGATVVGLDLSSVTNTCPVYIGVGYDLLNKENREVISK